MSEQNDSKFPKHVLKAIRVMQKSNGKLLLCGSAALILGDLLPCRHMHDVDFAVNEKNFNPSLYTEVTPYEGQDEEGYTSFMTRVWIDSKRVEINILVFDDEKFNSENIKLLDGSTIKSQSSKDILSWKQKYNRPKDIKDLNDIATKALEEAVFGGE